jgi:hypothetical protein
VAFASTDVALEAFPACEQYSHVRTVKMFAKAGVDVDALVAKLRDYAAKSFVDAWRDLMAHIDEQCATFGALNTTAEGVR